MKPLNNIFAESFLALVLIQLFVIPCAGQLPELEWGNHVAGSTQILGKVLKVKNGSELTSLGIFNDSLVINTDQGEVTFNQPGFNRPFFHALNGAGVDGWSYYLNVVGCFSNSKALMTQDSDHLYFTTRAGTWLTEEIDIDPGPDSTIMALYGDILIVKYSDMGEVMWARAITDHNPWPGSPREPRDIAVDNEGNVYTCGYFKGSLDFDPGPDTLILEAHAAGSGFIHKMNEVGELLWTGIPGEYGHVNAIAIDEWDNVYITGEYNDTVDIAPGPDTMMISGVTGNIEAYVLKLNPDGLTEWATGIGGGTFVERANSIALSPNGSILVCGTFTDTVNSYPLLLDEPLMTAGEEDIFIWELDTDGNSLNAYRIGGIEPDGGTSANNSTTKIYTDGEGNIYLYGTINHSSTIYNVDLDPGPDTAWSQDLGITHEFIAKFDPNMNLIWAMPGNGAADFAVGSNQALYITGSFTDTIDLDPGPVQQLYISEGGSDMYVLKLNQDSLLTSEQPIVSVGELEVSVYPNPSSGQFTVEVPAIEGMIDYSISDLSGRMVQGASVQSSRFTVELDAEPGVYLLRLWNNDDQAVVRLVRL